MNMKKIKAITVCFTMFLPISMFAQNISAFVGKPGTLDPR